MDFPCFPVQQVSCAGMHVLAVMLTLSSVQSQYWLSIHVCGMSFQEWP